MPTPTLAADLAHLVGEGAVPVPGVVHDPAMPLILGNEGAGLYCVQTYVPGTKRWQLQVIQGLNVAIMDMDALGDLRVNGVALGSLPSMVAAVNAASAAASAAATSAGSSAASAAAAAASAAAALVSENNAAASAATADTRAAAAQTSAQLSADYAQAPLSVTLPGGGKSSLESANDAGRYAISTRDMEEVDPISGNQTFAQTMLYKRNRMNGTALQTVTVPANIFTSAEKKAAYALLRNEGAGGSIKVVGAVGALDLQPSLIKAQGTFIARRKGITANQVFNISLPNIPAITNGKLFFNIISGWETLAATPTHTLTLNKSLTAAVDTALVSPIGVIYDPQVTQYSAPLVSTPLQTVTATLTIGPGLDWVLVDWWACEGTAGGTILRSKNVATSAASSIGAGFVGLGNQTLVLGSALQRGNLANIGFSGWAGGIVSAQAYSSSGIDDVSIPDTNSTRNFIGSRGSMLTSAAGDVNITGNFLNIANLPAIGLIAIPPTASIGAGTVNVKYVGGVDTISAQNQEMELSFSPDGTTVWVRAL